MASLRKQTSKKGKVSFLVDFCHQGKRIKKSFLTKLEAQAF
jgi:5S rRNA maturation endonuclease (ribonuclease M5)